MIQAFVDQFMSSEKEVKQDFADNPPTSYSDIVKRVVTVLQDTPEQEEVKENEQWVEIPDSQRITCIDDGEYQGTQLYIIGAKGYQPSTYYAVFVPYGSCGGCDTFESIQGYDWDEPLIEQQIKDYWTLALHMVQRMRMV